MAWRRRGSTKKGRRMFKLKNSSAARPAKSAKKPVKKASKSASGSKGSKPSKAKTARSGAVLRKRVAPPKLHLGIGAVNIAPPVDEPRTLGRDAAEAAMDKKATDIVLLDVREISGLCDEMLVATARSVPHLNAVADGVEEALRKQGERLIHSDGRRSAEPDWLLLDYGNLMVHIFRAEARDSYRLEDYYAEARLVAKWKNEEK
ncbi:MAG TPA: ribosome silencing factor [bacterium]|nr:ribosome silencing factor [bacterium]